MSESLSKSGGIHAGETPETFDPQYAEALQFLLELSADEALELFRTLEAPSSYDFPGDYDGHIPLLREEDWTSFVLESGLGRWLGKGFLSERNGDYSGIGYNRYLRRGQSIKRLLFAWTWGESELDGRTSLLMYYRAYRNWAGDNDLVDELRQYEPGVILGLYHTRSPVPRFTPRPGESRSAMEFFVLTGPVGPSGRNGLA